MKKIIILISFLFSFNCFAATEMTTSATPYAGPQILGYYPYPYINCPTCGNVDPYMHSAKLVENILFNKRTYPVYEFLGKFYINDEVVGATMTKSYREGILYINDRPITDYGIAKNGVTKNTAKDAADALFLHAYTKFILKDFKGAFEGAKKALEVDPTHKKAIILATISESILTGKVKPENVKEVSENSLDRIIKMSENLN